MDLAANVATMPYRFLGFYLSKSECVAHLVPEHEHENGTLDTILDNPTKDIETSKSAKTNRTQVLGNLSDTCDV